ncbi:uncharacterized protein LOC135150439 [Daucus carota subsp. sativus]|uniref:uncharacterized protein LOC135150439 n=1 Tax=Daucus carota subsp. sativus TaxID=79200 RepID=UPI0030831391
MDEEYTLWIDFPRYSQEYLDGVECFLQKGFPIFGKGDEMQCPCRKCAKRLWLGRDSIYDHLICNGPSLVHVQWICEVAHTKLSDIDDFMDCETGKGFEDNLDDMFDCTGKGFENVNEGEQGPNKEAAKFYRHVREGKQPLYPGCTKFSRLSFMIRLYHLKCVHGITESAFGDLLGLMKDAFPNAVLPQSFIAAKNIIKDLGLDYQKIHACPNNCMLFWAENSDKEVCDNCGASRWVVQEKKGTAANSDPDKLIHKVPSKIMRYFPLKPRLQRLFMCKDYSKLMTWHDVAKKRREIKTSC